MAGGEAVSGDNREMTMPALGSLEEIAEQSAFSINPEAKTKHVRGPGRKLGCWGISPNMEHSKVAREPAKPKPAPPAIAPPTIARPPSPIGRLIATYDDVVDVFRARADELELSRLEIDHLSGLAQGHSSHLLAKKYTQRFGAISLRLMLDVMGLRLLVVEDPDLTARTLKRRTPRKSSHLRVMRKLSAPST